MQMNCKWVIIAFEGADSSDSKGSVSACAAGCFRVVWPDPEDSKREVSMLKLQSVVTLACIGVVLGVHWFLTPQKTMAQAPNTLVIVTNAFDHELVRRVGDKVVQVEVLFAPEADMDCATYEVCNNRVQELRGFRLLLFQENIDCPVERFWRNRMSAANPQAEMHRLPQSRHRTELEGRIQRLKEIHAALVSMLPEQRDQLDVNLQFELHRLRGPQMSGLRLALHD